jgi:hypothetical protein
MKRFLADYGIWILGALIVLGFLAMAVMKGPIG